MLTIGKIIIMLTIGKITKPSSHHKMAKIAAFFNLENHIFKSNMALTGENFKIIVNYKMRKLWGGSRKNGVIPPEKQTKLVFGII